MRLNKHIAETGFCSRREANRLIADKRVVINGKPGGIGSQECLVGVTTAVTPEFLSGMAR